MLLWHKHDVEKSLADLANFTPFPDEWTVEDKVLFEQAFSFHGKSFARIQQMVGISGQPRNRPPSPFSDPSQPVAESREYPVSCCSKGTALFQHASEWLELQGRVLRSMEALFINWLANGARGESRHPASWPRGSPHAFDVLLLCLRGRGRQGKNALGPKPVATGSSCER